MDNLSRICCLCRKNTCKHNQIVCDTCKNYDSVWTWKIPSTMDYIEYKFFENIETLSEEKKEELIKLLSKK